MRFSILREARNLGKKLRAWLPQRCYYCHKIVWFWQPQWLGSTPAHARCDFLAFERDTERIASSFEQSPLARDEWVKDQLEKHSKFGYG